MPTIQETISQVLSPTNAPYINGVQAKLTFAKAVLEAVYQGLVEKDGKGVSGKFVTEAEANGSAQVFVNKLKPHYDKGRQHGAAKNGGAFNNTGYMSRTETVGIEILELFDAPIIVPRATQDRIPLDLAAGEIANYVKGINTALNGSSWAAKWLATFGVTSDKRNVVEISASDVSNKLVLSKIQLANSLLDEGDYENDIDSFDMDTRCMTFKMAYRPTLLQAGVLVAGGANYAYDIVRSGAVDPTSKRNLDDGLWGEVDGVEVHGISNLSLRYAAWYCGMPEKEFIDGTYLVGWDSSAYANARGFSTVEQIKIIDAHGGQGIEIQPITKLGAICWYPKGNVALVSDDDYDPIASLKTMFSGVASGITFKLKSGGSRYYADGSVSAISNAAFTCSATAKDDGGVVDHIKGAYFIVSTKELKTVGEFLAEDSSATYKGSVTLGSSKSTTIAANSYVNVLVIADDGTCTLFAKKNA